MYVCTYLYIASQNLYTLCILNASGRKCACAYVCVYVFACVYVSVYMICICKHKYT